MKKQQGWHTPLSCSILPIEGQAGFTDGEGGSCNVLDDREGEGSGNTFDDLEGAQESNDNDEDDVDAISESL